MNKHEVVIKWALRLYEAVENVDVEAVKDLVHRMGACSDIVLQNYGASAIHLAVGIEPASFSKEATSLFLRCGANPNVRSSEGLTPVHVASIWGRTENLELLLLAGGDPLFVDEDGYTPLQYAEEQYHLACVDIIKKFLRNDMKYGTPALEKQGLFGEGCQPIKSGNFNSLLFRNGLSKREMNLDLQKWKLSLPRLFANAGEDENTSRDVYFSEKKFNQRMTNDSLPEVVDLISDDNRSEGSFILIDESDISSELDHESKCLQSLSEATYSIHSSPDIKHSNFQHHENDGVLPADSVSVLAAVLSEQNDGTVAKKNDKTFCLLGSPYVNSSNSSCDALNGRVSPCEAGSTHDICVSEMKRPSSLSYCNFLLSAECSNSSTPLQKKVSKTLSHSFKEIDTVHNKNELDISGNGASTLSTSCPEIQETYFGEENRNITYRRKLPNPGCLWSNVISPSWSESEEYFTVPEEVYEYTDDEEGIVLEEKRLETPLLSGLVVQERTREELPQEGLIFRAKSESSLGSCCTEDIRKELYKVVSCGCRCPLGPITATTKRVYARMILKFKKANKCLVDKEPLLPLANADTTFSRELEETLKKPSKLSHGKYFELEQKMMQQFDGVGKFSQWREGNQRNSFNYLLLDPRVTLNLPLRWASDGSPDKSFYSNRSSQYYREFLSAIFYVGKGKRSRPYSHLYEAVTVWQNDCNDSKKKKIKHIVDIWKENLGVVCIHLFQNAIPAEALTREAAMIDALGLKNLTNEQRGRYYGLISSLGFSEKRYFGSFLLHRALIIFLAEGERQIRPSDV